MALAISFISSKVWTTDIRIPRPRGRRVDVSARHQHSVMCAPRRHYTRHRQHLISDMLCPSTLWDPPRPLVFRSPPSSILIWSIKTSAWSLHHDWLHDLHSGLTVTWSWSDMTLINYGAWVNGSVCDSVCLSVCLDSVSIPEKEIWFLMGFLPVFH
jgi:hypothetical protein